MLRPKLPFTLFFAACCLSACSKHSASPDPTGIWRGTVKNPSGEQVNFALEIKRNGTNLTADLINGGEKLAASSVTLTGDRLKVRYDFYDGTLEARLQGDQLTGAFTRQWEKKTLARELHATRKPPETPASSPIANLGGDWLLKVGAPENQRLWRAALQDTGYAGTGYVATGTIITVSGDWGQMAGTWTGGTLTLHRFDGINSRVLRLTPQADGTLTGEVDLGLFDPKRPVIAERISDKNKDLVATLPDPATHTRMKNPAEPFRFSAADLSGQTIAWNDPRFKNKVVAVSITGSWCPNCHEESPFMQSLYEKYKPQGFEVIALAFEYTGDPARDRAQLRLFAQRHALTYPLLLAGSTDEAPQKLDQLINFGAYPTTIFIGRDGTVKQIHAGFEGSATGDRFTQLKADIESQIQQLLAEK